MISATWWTNSTIYSRILQVLFQHAALNLITTKWEFTLLQYSRTLSSIIASFCIIFDICYMMNQQYYIYSRILQVLFQRAALNLITTKWELTLLHYFTTLSSIIASFCIIFDICYMMNQQYYIYSRILPVLISACRNQFNHYKTWIYSISVFYITLKHNRIILYHIWYLLHDEPTVLYIPEYSQYVFQHAALNLMTKSSEFTLFHYTTTLSSIIASFCVIFDICYMMNQQCYIYSKYSQYWFQHDELNLITTKWEFTLLQYSTTLSSIIASFCIIFDICYMMNQQYYIYSGILPVLISACRNQFNHCKKWIYSISVF